MKFIIISILAFIGAAQAYTNCVAGTMALAACVNTVIYPNLDRIDRRIDTAQARIDSTRSDAYLTICTVGDAGATISQDCDVVNWSAPITANRNYVLPDAASRGNRPLKINYGIGGATGGMSGNLITSGSDVFGKWGTPTAVPMTDVYSTTVLTSFGTGKWFIQSNDSGVWP